MCIICIDLIKHKMTLDEATRAAREITVLSLKEPEKHAEDLMRALDNLNFSDQDTMEKLSKILDEGTKQ